MAGDPFPRLIVAGDPFPRLIITDRDLLRRHIEAVWDLTLPQQLLSRAHQAGDAWKASFEMRREVVFQAPVISDERQTQAARVARQ